MTDATTDRDTDNDAKQTRATLDPWLEARLELKPLAATLARRWRARLPRPRSIPERRTRRPRLSSPRRPRDFNFKTASVAAGGASSRANLARVLPDVDEFNARCRAMGVQARVAPAWDAAPSASAAGADGASVSVVARLTRGLSARAVVELEASAIDDVTASPRRGPRLTFGKAFA